MRNLHHLILICLAIGVFRAEPALGQQNVSEEEIVKALSPPLTRSLSTRQGSAYSPAEDAFIDSLRTGGTRSLSITERPKLDTLAADKPSFDLPVEFDTNSFALGGDALDIVKKLGKALSTPGLRNQTFLLMGHTDAKGSEQANLMLSERRAGAVKQFLVANFGLKPENLIAVGYGKTHLRKPDAPFARENRRVQTVNIKAYAAQQ
jgi:outer membrane protein OmpA-like peptidoglycan-associated protein